MYQGAILAPIGTYLGSLNTQLYFPYFISKYSFYFSIIELVFVVFLSAIEGTNFVVG
jgi:hypothetical protein